MTVKSGAFQHLKQLEKLEFLRVTIKTIEKEGFKLNSSNDFSTLKIQFNMCNLTGETFENGTFDGVSKPIEVILLQSNISYLSSGAFKTVLNDPKGVINFFNDDVPQFNSKLDCSDCRNYWLIKENKEKQVTYANCKGENRKTLFHSDIKTKLSQKCK